MLFISHHTILPVWCLLQQKPLCHNFVQPNLRSSGTTAAFVAPSVRPSVETAVFTTRITIRSNAKTEEEGSAWWRGWDDDDDTSRRDNDLRARLREISRPFIFTWYLDLHGFSDDVWDYLTELTDWWDLGKTKAFLKLPEGISEMRVLATFEVGLIGRLKWKYLWHLRIDDIARRRRLLFFAVWRKWWELLRN